MILKTDLMMRIKTDHPKMTSNELNKTVKVIYRLYTDMVVRSLNADVKNVDAEFWKAYAVMVCKNTVVGKRNMLRLLVNTGYPNNEMLGNYYFSTEFINHLANHVGEIEKEMPGFGAKQLEEMRTWKTTPTPLINMLRYSPIIIKLAKEFGLDKCSGDRCEIEVLVIPARLRRYLTIHRVCGREHVKLAIWKYWDDLCQKKRRNPATIIRSMGVAMRCYRKIKKYY